MTHIRVEMAGSQNGRPYATTNDRIFLVTDLGEYEISEIVNSYDIDVQIGKPRWLHLKTIAFSVLTAATVGVEDTVA